MTVTLLVFFAIQTCILLVVVGRWVNKTRWEIDDRIREFENTQFMDRLKIGEQIINKLKVLEGNRDRQETLHVEQSSLIEKKYEGLVNLIRKARINLGNLHEKVDELVDYQRSHEESCNHSGGVEK